MAKVNNKDPQQKQPGEKQPGTFHFNPGNMSGKKAGLVHKDEAEQPSNRDDTPDGRRRQAQKP